MPSQPKVTRRADGRYQASLQVKGVRQTVYGKSEKEVRTKLTALRQQAVQSGVVVVSGRHTLMSLVDEWLETAPGIRPTTAEVYRKFLRLYAFPALGGERLERITPDRLQRLYASLTPAVADKIHRVLHRAFAVAVRWRWLPENPCDRVIRPHYRAAERAVWSAAQAQVFISGVEGHWLGPLFVLMITTGLRLGEALALRWDDAGVGVAVSVNGTLHHVDGKPVIGAPKTASGRRTVILPPVAIAALQRQQLQQDGWRTRVGEWPDAPHIFTGKTGKPLPHRTPEYAIRRICSQLGLPIITPHGLRHLHASLLIDEGVPITAVSARLGHANPQITLRLYAHALPGQDKAAAEAIGRALGGRR